MKAQVLFRQKSRFHWKRSLSNKVVTVEEEQDGTDTDGIGNLMYLTRLMFIDEECGNLKVVLDGGEQTRSNNRKRKSEVLQADRCPLCDKSYRRDQVFLRLDFFVGR